LYETLEIHVNSDMPGSNSHAEKEGEGELTRMKIFAEKVKKTFRVLHWGTYDIRSIATFLAHHSIPVENCSALKAKVQEYRYGTKSKKLP